MGEKFYESQWGHATNRLLTFCSTEERNPVRFGTTWGWVSV